MSSSRPAVSLACRALLLCALSSVIVPSLSVAEAAEQVNAPQLAELRELKRAQLALEADHSAAAEACQSQFAVNDCLDQLRRQHRVKLQALKQREDTIEAGLRRARAEAQRERVRQRHLEFAEGEAARRSEALLTGEVAASETVPAAVSTTSAKKPSKSTSGLGVQLRQQQAEEAARRHALQRAEQERRLKAHQRDVKKRLDQGKKDAAQPLPLPSAAEIAATKAIPQAKPQMPSIGSSAPALRLAD